MEARFAHLVEAKPELLAEHSTGSGMIEKAIGYCLKAGLRSRDRFAHAEAMNHLAKGLRMLEALEASPERDAANWSCSVRWELPTSLHVGMQRLKSVRYSIALARCAAGGPNAELFTIMWGNFAFHIVRGDFRTCSELVDEAMAFGEPFNDTGILIEALFLKGLTRLYRGDFAGARDCSRVRSPFDDRERTAF